MKVTEDGEQADDSALSIVLVFFDVYQKSIEVTIRRTMEEFLSSLQSELSRPFHWRQVNFERGVSFIVLMTPIP